MKRLTLLRHAKSDWDDPVARDFDRPLNHRGEKAALLMGQFAARRQMQFDALVASPAVRVVQTLETFFAGFGETLDARWDRRIYLASSPTLFDVIRDLPDSAESALLTGHNPGLEELILDLVPAVFSTYLPAYLALAIPIVAPQAVLGLFHTHPFHEALSVLTFTFLVAAPTLAAILGRQFVGGLALRFENLRLIEDLRRQRVL